MTARRPAPWKRGLERGRLVLTALLFVATHPLQDLMRRRSLLGDLAFFDPSVLAWTATLEAEWRTIRSELDEVMRFWADIPNFQDISVENRPLSDDDRWKTFFFMGWGARLAGNCARCPRTAALLDQIPGLKSAFFSILGPRKHVPAHRGPWAGVLRYHLGLIVPEPCACRIRVGDQVRHWREGESLVFDDTREHEVWNDLDAPRVVLFLDIARPLPRRLAAANALAMRLIARSSLAAPALERFAAWDARLGRVWLARP